MEVLQPVCAGAAQEPPPELLLSLSAFSNVSLSLSYTSCLSAGERHHHERGTSAFHFHPWLEPLFWKEATFL